HPPRSEPKSRRRTKSARRARRQIRNPKSAIRKVFSLFLPFCLWHGSGDDGGSRIRRRCLRGRGTQEWIGFELLDRFVLVHILHQLEPRRQSGFAARFLITESDLFVEADPDSGYQRWCVADEPCVREVIRGAGFARDGSL